MIDPSSTVMSADHRSLFEVADAVEDRTGVVLFETQTHLENGKCLFGQHPLKVLRGSFPRDLRQIQDALSHLKKAGLLNGVLAGWIGYDGEFVFGVYSELQSSQRVASLESEDLGIPEEKCLQFSPQMTKREFCKRVERVKAYIAAGDIYQVNLSYPWLAKNWQHRDFWPFYRALRRKSPAPFGAYLNLAGIEVASSSPELFLSIQGNTIQTRPIKGTRPRGVNASKDKDLELELVSSLKERSELVMITDLERNDLGQVCEYGSVKVKELLKLEKYAQVQHLVSTVEGVLREDVDHVEALAACFPGGSITGAPKKRAMEIIQELELESRGLYTGAIGYFGVNGESQFSIAIRTAWREGEKVRFDTGAGIVADSDPVGEWEETRHKAAGLLSV